MTEKRLVEILQEFGKQLRKDLHDSLHDSLQQSLQKELEPIRQDIKELKIQMKQVLGYQHRESRSIEYEINALVRKHLQSLYPLYEIREFPVKKIRDPRTDKVVTDLDGAFVLTGISHRKIIDEDRLSYVQSLNLQEWQKPLRHEGERQFVLIEAKHHMTPKKVGYKFRQVEILLQFFQEGQKVRPILDARKKRTGEENKQEKDLLAGYHRSFLGTVVQYEIFKDLNLEKNLHLILGASVWTPGLLEKLQEDSDRRKKLHDEFQRIALEDKDPEVRVRLFEQMRAIDAWWLCPKLNVSSDPYGEEEEDDIDTRALFEYPTTSREEILILRTVPSALYYLEELVHPSGSRFEVLRKTPDPTAGANLLRGGTSKTARRSKSKRQDSIQSPGLLA